MEKNEALEKLRDAHEKMCDQMLAILEKDEPTVQELKLVAQFLKDNGIEALPVQDSRLAALKEEMEDRVMRLPSFEGEITPFPRDVISDFPLMPHGRYGG